MKNIKLKGVIGVISNNSSEIELAIKNNLQCVEIRADLLLNKGISIDEVCELVRNTRLKNLICLFTIRHRNHGGKFFGTENERIKINKLALDSGANIIDLEWGTEAELAMAKENVPLIISHHDFLSMPSNEELNRLTLSMEEHSPFAIKIVPTASKNEHSVRMLKWIQNGEKNKIHRIGFTMGIKGVFSRILATVFGSPITYASFGESVAPGQLTVKKMIHCYRIQELKKGCSIFGIAGENVYDSKALDFLNYHLKRKIMNAVAIPLDIKNFFELCQIAEDLKINGIQIDYPFKEIVKHLSPTFGEKIEGSFFLEFLNKDSNFSYRLFNCSGEDFLKKV